MVSKTSRRSVKGSAMLRFGGLVLLFVAFCLSTARSDEGGISFWVPGQFGSLAAVPAQPGWSAAGIYYQTTVNAGGNVAAARQFTIGRFSRTLNVDLNANLHARADLIFLNGTYVLPTPVLG